MVREDHVPERQPLSTAKAALLEKWLRGTRHAAARIPRAPSAGPAALSFAQHRLWFLHRLHPDSAAYNMVNAYRLRGTLDAGALARALSEVVRRHEALRTTFRERDGEPVQVVHPPADVPLPLFDLAALAPEAREEARRRHHREETALPLDLARGPILRARLLRLAPDDHELVVTVHHVAFDEGSELRFTKELALLYGAFARGEASPLPEPPIQYSDYARWQRERLQGSALDAQVARWRRRLEGLAPLDLPTDHPRPAMRSERGSMHAFALPADLSERVRALCREEGATLFMGLLGAFQALLHRHSGQDDVAVGSPVSGRTHAETEDLVGFFVNTLVLRTDLSGAPTFRQLLQRVRTTCLDAYADQEVPFERLVEELHPERDLSRPPLFQVLFSLQNAVGEPPRMEGLSLESRFVESPTSKFDLSLYALDHPDGIRGWLEFSADLFEPETAARLAERFRVLLDAACRDPDRPVASLPILAPEDERLAHASGEPLPAQAPAHERFLERARLHPERECVAMGDERATYAELAARSARVASRLRRAGVRPGDAVALCAERGVDLVAAALGVLRAGAAYLPLDPSYPRERLRFMLEDSGAALLLAQPGLADGLAPEGVRVLPLRGDGDEDCSEPAPDVPVDAASPAYVLYTSGSTGQPKGTVVHHGALANLLEAVRREVDAGEADALLSVTTLSFDIGTLEMLLPLVTGGRLLLVPRDVARDGRALLRRLPEATILQATPSTWRMLVDAGWAPGGATRERLKAISGGEPLAPDLARALLERVAALWNGYGPTETTIYSTFHRVLDADAQGARVPIGRPLANTRVYVLDARGQPCPVGVPGEMHIGGAGVAQGYLRRPEMTAQRFVPDPFLPGERVYRTGDLVRWRADGALDFLGRLDRQVKVRGHRIELSEVEHALAAHPDVAQALALAREDEPGDARLAAYVVPRASADDLPARLQSFLRERLPEALVPSAIVTLPQFPLLPNGKVDARALPRPDAGARAARAFAEPGTPTERALARMWADMLRVERVGADDGFFALGGHSLLATRMLARLRDAHGVDLPLRVLFATPALRDVAAAVDRLAASAPDDALRPLPARDGLPLSFAQERMWFLHQLDPASPAYNMAFVRRVRGPLDAAALRAALGRVVARHEALRATVRATDAGPVHAIRPPAPVPLPVDDLGALPTHEREARADALCAQEAERPFDLARGPLLRARLLRLAPDDHLLLLCVHHVAFDERSWEVVLKEISSCYHDLAEGREPALAPPALQHGDHAAWQRRRFEEGAMEAHLEAWRARLEGVPPLELPADRPRPARPTFRGGHARFTLPAPVAARLDAIAREHGATPFMVLLAAFEAFLHRRSGQEDFAVAAPHAGREDARLADVVGLFVNTLALRADLRGDPTFRELVERAKATCVDAYAHADAPFEKVVERLHPDRAHGAPLAQVFLSLQEDGDGDGDADALGDGRMVPTPTAKFDLSLFASRRGGALDCILECSADLFDDGTAARMAVQMETLLAGVAEAPDARVSALPILPESERALLAAWNATDAPFDATPVHERVAAQAARAPDAVAVEQGGKRLTYAQLDARASVLAQRLRAAGAGPGALVGVCLERSPDLVAALLAVLKTGAAYVPMDPAYPPARLRAMAEDARLSLYVTQRALLARLPEGAAAVLADEDEDARGAADAPKDAALEGLAYVIYTSGSTGRPKGVAVPHDALANLLEAMRRELDVRPGDRWLAVTTVSFDIAALELYLPLLCGATVVLAARDEAADPRALAALAADATLLQATPATWRMLVESGWEGSARLRALCGGEALPPDLAHRLRRRVGALWNVYGPTETTIWSTAHRVERDEPRVPIGRPLANTRVHVLDARGEPCPVGVPGELCIGGAGVARGYLGQPDLTAQRFIPDPFLPGERVYRTGDLVRWRADGALDFLGRLDRQVKVRGFRIEPAEVEAALRAHPDVREAAAVAREDTPGDARLVAYVVPRDPARAPDAAELRAFLRERLPEHMVPTSLVALVALPLTPNGKVDARALPAPDAAQAAQAARVAPRDATEEAVAALWRDLLRVEDVGVTDDFFALGGHSLLATRLSTRLRSALGVDVPLRDLFAAPTVEAQARLVDARRAPAPAGRAPGADEEREDALSFGQQRMLFLHGLDPESPAYNMAVCRRLRGPLDAGALRHALAEVVRRHAPLRTTFETGPDGRAAPRAHPAAPVPLPVETVAGATPEAREKEARRVASEEAHRPFDLARGPVLRARLLRLDAEDHLLLLCVHHVAFDEWSEKVLLDELAAAYEARLAGRPPRLAPLSISYEEHARRQHARLRDGALAAQLAHWRERLRGLPPLDLPTDRPRPAAPTTRGGHAPLVVPGGTLARLRALCSAEGATLHMGLLAAFDALLHRHSGQEDFAVGVPVAGRLDAESEDLVGFFVNTLPLRADLSGGPSFRELLRRTRLACLDAYANQEAPFERLVEEAGAARGLQRMPLFQTAFLLHPAPDARRLAPGLVAEPFALPARTAKFDLTLALADRGADLAGSLEYSADLFDAQTVERMGARFLALLDAMLEDPEAPLARLPMLTPEERARLEAWNDTAVPLEGPRTMHGLFEAQARLRPRAPALRQGGATLTYAELDARANRLARLLLARGVRRGDLVGVSMPRGPDAFVAVLAALKAGAAFLPLDPTYPRERLAFMAEDARPRVVVTLAATAASLPVDPARVLALDGEEDALATQPAEAPAVEVGPDDLAYVIYTSGSTGKPKGVMLPHLGACNLAAAQARLFGLGPDDRVLQFASLNFDASVWEMLMAFAPGATLCLQPPEATMAGHELLAALLENGITIATLPPTALATLDPDADLPSLRTLVVAGEPCAPPLVEKWSRGRRFVNAYGPTEASVCATAYVGGDEPARALPIGRPLANVQAHVLDAHGQPVPVGVPGELCVGGLGLARGYLNRPELTAERFIPSPFRAGERLYRTGDLVRRLPDGELEFLGRLDHQVKVRGFRIELGEVEAALLSHPSVAEAVVVAREDSPGDKRLVAYATTGSAPLDAAALRRHLEACLPAHMVPSAFVLLDRFPLSPNGKVDRKALPRPEAARAAAPQDDDAAPRTREEAILAEVWAEVLGVPVGVHDNFFELGGDSILSIQVVARATRRGLHLTTRQMFDHQTVADLAAHLQAARRVDAEQGTVEGAATLTPIQRWFFARDLPSPHHFNQSVLLEVPEGVEAAHLREAMRALVAHHDALRLRFARGADGAWTASHSSPEEAGEGLFAAVDLSALRDDAAAQDAALAAEADKTQAGLDLARGPLVHALLFDLGPERPRRLLLLAHHLVVDGVSWRILLEDLDAACAQLARGRPPRLPPKTTSYKAWAERLAAHTRGSAALRDELPYWLTQADEARIPVDHPGGANAVASERDVVVRLDAADTQALLRDATQARGARVDELLLAAFAQALARWTGRPATFLEVEGHGREEILEEVDLSRTVGWFTTLRPLKVSLRDADDLDAVLRDVQAALRAAPARGIGHGLLRHLAGDAAADALARLPQPEVSFNYLGRFDAEGADAARLRMVEGDAGREHARDGTRHRLIEVNGSVMHGQLRMRVSYSEDLHERATVERLAADFEAALRRLARGAPDAAHAPRFPLVDLPPAKLARVLAGRGRVVDAYPLSPMQQGMVFHSLREPGSGVYVEQTCFLLEGDLDADALERAWRALVARHAVLRTGFAWEGLDEPLQLVHADAPLPFERLDWRGVPAEEHEARLDAFLRDDRARGFDLARPPLMRVTLVRLDDARHRMVWTNHHALLDGWSLPTLLAELDAAYAALREGKEPALPPVRPFSDFIARLRARPSGEAFWRERLAGLEEPTPLGVDRPAREGELLPGEARVLLSPEAFDGLQRLARRCRVTLGTILQGAWAVVLGRYAGRDDVLFGATVSGRTPELEGVESMVGLFINTIPIRVRLPADEPIEAWLPQLQREQNEAREHEHTPLVDVQRWSRMPRGASLFDSILVLENYPTRDDAGRALPLRDVRGLSRTNYPLTVVAAPGERFSLRLFHDRVRLADDAVARMARHLERVLETFARDPARPVGSVDVLSDDERARLDAWGAPTTSATPRHLRDLLAEQAARAPDAVAVEKGNERWTYARLDARAEALAARLRALGVGPDTLVAVSLEPSPDLVAALLGVLKAGGAYVPLDPSYPEERLAHMLDDSEAPLLLTSRALAPRFAAARTRVLALEDADAQPVAPAGDARAGSPDDLAYVIYTSGSTGKPKGVLVTHRGAAALAEAQREAFGVESGTRVLQFASWSFDASFWEMLMALASGATLCMMPERAAGDALETFLREQDIDVATLPPSAIRTLDPGRLPRLRVLVSAGEELPEDLRDEWAADRLLVNAYGPTEATVCATAAVCRPGEGTPTIGRPFAASRIALLDPLGRRVPPGVPGELCIGGDGLARGYHKRPDLTAQRFVEDPDRPGGRLYRTGDLARWRADGELEFLGRLDHQVKVRGHRIEPGEVEAALRAHPRVRDAFVMARPGADGAVILVAYLVPDGEEPDAAELRAFLARALPEPMLPSAFVPLGALPLTPNGKVDRKALPDPQQGRHLATPYVAPRDAVEEMLAAIWARVLGAPRVGVRDDFFDLGGHSLTATQVASRVRDAFGVELPLRTVFAARTVEALAREVRALREDDARALALPPVEASAERGPAPLSFSQQRLWFLDQWEPGSAVYNVPAFYRLAGPLDARALESALSEALRRHEILRTTYVLDERGRPTQVVQPHERPALDVTDLSRLPDDEREREAQRLADAEARAPFDLARGPVHRLRLLRLGAHEHWLLMTFHHVAFDGWSMGVLLDELGSLYEAAVAGREPDLPEPTVQYADFARWQRAHLDERALEPQMRHWRDALRGLPPLELPTDKPRPKVQSFRGGHHWFALPEALSARLKELSREEGVTLFMPLLAAFQALLHRHSGQDDFAVGSPVAGRTRAETERLVGFFVNTLVLRADLSGDPTFRELLRRVRDACLAAYANQDVPFERLVHELQPQRDAGRSPLFQAMFVLQEGAIDAAQWGPLRVSGIPASSLASKFDLTLFVANAQDRLEGLLEYRTDLFEPATMARVARRLEALLESVVADPDQPVSRLRVLSDEERALVAEAWTGEERPFPSGACLHELFEEHVARAPDAPAVSFQGEETSYATLDARAEAVAALLAERGVRPGDAVGVCVGRSVDTAAAFLGVLKAGAAYLPLDARHPPERLAATLRDAGARVVLAHERLAPALGAYDGERVLLDRLPLDAPAGGRRSEARDRPDALAYVLYTSGSTGKPKGVLVEHRSVCNLARALQDRFRIGPASRVLQFAPPAFDGAIAELAATLTAGACLVVPPPDSTLTGDDLRRALVDGRVSVAVLPPAALGTLAPDAPLPHLDTLVTAGDVLPPDLARAWSRRVRLLNAYGPTECTVGATVALVEPDAAGAPPIGTPLPNVRAYVLDAQLQPVPVGVPGELCLGGVGVARGYLGQPELTAERFLPDPFRPGGRMYRTGDLARWRADGQLEFLGRLDHQVKIRGFRVEPGEIEAALRAHAGVKDAVVVAREDAPGDRRLVAYVVPAGEGVAAADLRRHLASTLPDHMVPAAFVALDALPLTPNGKVDRRELPAPEGARLDASREYVAPRTPDEAALCAVWAEALGLERVGVRDNFFELGGDSILSIRVIALAKRHGLALEPKQLFEHQTVEALARSARERPAQAPRSLVTLRGGGARPPFFCVHPAGGGVGCYLPLVQALPPDQPFQALQAAGVDDDVPPRRDVAEMARAYVREVRAAQPTGPYHLGGWSFGALVALEMARELRAQGEEVRLLALLDPAPPGGTGEAAPPALPDLDALEPAALAALLRQLGLPDDASEEARPKVARHLRAFRAHADALRAHEARPLDVPATLLASEDTLKRRPDLEGAWAALVRPGMRVRRLPGDHASLVLDPAHARALAAALDDALRRASQGGSP